LHRNFSSIPHPDCACGDDKKKKLPFNRKKPLSEPDSGGGAVCLDQLGFERTGNNKPHNTRPGMPAEKEKHKLMTAVMLYVHGE